MKPKFWWIKERYNPQLGVYYVPCGQLTISEARRKENSLYGTNCMKRFETEEKYLAEVMKLKKQGKRFYMRQG